MWVYHVLIITYPSEKYDFVSWDGDIPFPTVSGKSFKIPWFQSPPTSIWNNYTYIYIYIHTPFSHPFMDIIPYI